MAGIIVNPYPGRSTLPKRAKCYFHVGKSSRTKRKCYSAAVTSETFYKMFCVFFFFFVQWCRVRHKYAWGLKGTQKTISRAYKVISNVPTRICYLSRHLGEAYVSNIEFIYAETSWYYVSKVCSYLDYCVWKISCRIYCDILLRFSGPLRL